MNAESRRVTEPLLEFYLVDSLDAEARAQVEAVLAESAADRKRLEELRAESTAFLVQHPPGPLVERFEASQFRWWRSPLMLLVPVLASVVLMVLLPGSEADKAETKLQQQVAEENAVLARVRQQVAEQNAVLAKVQQQVAEGNTALAKVQQQVAKGNAVLARVRQQVAEENAALARVQQQVAEGNAALARVQHERAAKEPSRPDKAGMEHRIQKDVTIAEANSSGAIGDDIDGDGVGDSQDKCPMTPGSAERDGCPRSDADSYDKDGIENAQDECPDGPGPLERKGCPTEDTDKDGVPNWVDSCTHEPGPESNLGCSEHEVPLVAITPSSLELRSKVHFEVLQARIQQRSLAVLDWVAKVLREHPEIERVVVGAHTDDRGLADENRRLSQQRAEGVRRYLMEKGVAAERLEARGYGSDRPIDSNATSIGRETNRRVDFRIIRGSEAGPKTP